MVAGAAVLGMLGVMGMTVIAIRIVRNLFPVSVVAIVMMSPSIARKHVVVQMQKEPSRESSNICIAYQQTLFGKISLLAI